MTQPFIAELRIFSFNFAPRGWAFCNGQLLPINQNAALFSLLGTAYGGDGRQTFALPNLQSRVPVHVGPSNILGQTGGEESVTLTVSQIPPHTHQMRAKNAKSDINVAGESPGPTETPAIGQTGSVSSPVQVSMYSSSTANETMSPNAVANTGGQSHENRQPYLAINVCIALSGIFPSRT